MKKRVLYILQVCQSLNWGTAERVCFKESMLLKSQGHEVFLCCIKDSPISNMAINAGINCIHLNLSKMGLLAISQSPPLKQKIKNYEIQVVHNYSYDNIWAICYMLRDLPAIPLVMSHYTYPRQFFKFPLYKTLTGRIDKIFSSSKDMCEDISLILKIPKHRLEEMSFCYSNRTYSGTFQKNENEFQIGMMVDWEHDQEDTFAHIFDALFILNSKNDERKTIFELFTNRKFENHILFESLKDLAAKHNVADWVRFRGGQDYVYTPEEIDLWFSFHGEDQKDSGPIEDINDQVIEALGRNIPVLMARNGGSMELVKTLGDKIEVYRPFEARDLALKILQIQTSYKKYKSRYNSEAISALFSPEVHLHRLVSTYQRLIAKRENFSRRKMLLGE